MKMERMREARSGTWGEVVSPHPKRAGLAFTFVSAVVHALCERDLRQGARQRTVARRRETVMANKMPNGKERKMELKSSWD